MKRYYKNVHETLLLSIFIFAALLLGTAFADASPKEQFLTEYKPKYTAIHRLYQNCQIEAEFEPWPAKNRSSEYSVFLSNGKMLRSETTYLKPVFNDLGKRKSPLQDCAIINPKIGKFTSRRQDENSSYVISNKQDGIDKATIENFYLFAPHAMAPYGILGNSVLDWLEMKDCKVLRFEKKQTTEGGRAYLEYGIYFDDVSSPVKGEFTFDTDHAWVLTQATYFDGSLKNTMTYEGEKDGVPLLKSLLVEQFNDKNKLVSTKKYTVNKFIPEPAPESMFTFASLDIDYKPPPVSRFSFWFYCGLVGVVLIIGGGLLSRWVKAR